MGGVFEAGEIDGGAVGCPFAGLHDVDAGADPDDLARKGAQTGAYGNCGWGIQRPDANEELPLR